MEDVSKEYTTMPSRDIGKKDNNNKSENKHRFLDVRSREIIVAVDKYFNEEREQVKELLRLLPTATRPVEVTHLKLNVVEDAVTVPQDLYLKMIEFLNRTTRVSSRVVEATKINKNTISRIRNLAKVAEVTGARLTLPSRKKRSPAYVLTEYELSTLKNIIDAMPKASIGRIWEKAKSDLSFKGGKSTLLRIMKAKLNYRSTTQVASPKEEIQKLKSIKGSKPKEKEDIKVINPENMETDPLEISRQTNIPYYVM